MPELRRLRVGNHHGVSIVEHEGNADRGVMVASITAAPKRSFEDALGLAREICNAVNAAREARERPAMRPPPTDTAWLQTRRGP